MSHSNALIQTTSHEQPPRQQQLATTQNRSSLQSIKPSSPSSLVSTALPKLDLTPRREAATGTPVKSPVSRPHGTPRLESPKPSTPGKWQHPRLEEVIRRQEKTRFDRDNVTVIIRNGLALLPTVAVPSIVDDYVLALPKLAMIPSWPSWLAWAGCYSLVWMIRLLLLGNIGVALAPLFRKADACEDIPLDPAQRKLLGLPPMSRPATPLERDQWVTPPRFSRTNTPLSATASLRVNASDSPGSSLLDSSMQLPGSPFSPSSLQNSQLRSGGVRRRLSYTSTRNSPLSASDFDVTGSGGTPSKNNRASVTLNNKWLYEKGWASPRGSPRLGNAMF